jgi:adenylate kinase
VDEAARFVSASDEASRFVYKERASVNAGAAMRLILLGPPASGKGTQAQLLSSRLGMAHISTGDLLRAAKAAGTPLGLRAKAFMDAGKLVPDELVNDLVAERFRQSDRPSCFLMDGYPRTVAQAEAFARLLDEVRLPITGVILLNASDGEIIYRTTGRLTCPNPKCSVTYHVKNRPPKVAGACDRCGTALVHRADDQLEQVRTRLEEYHGQTAELVPFYREHGTLHAVEGQGDVETIYQNIVAALRPQAGSSC